MSLIKRLDRETEKVQIKPELGNTSTQNPNLYSPKLYIILILFIIGFMNMARFVGLEDSPPGFYVDESAGAAHILCLSQTAHDADGKAFPFLYSVGAGYGLHTFPYIYSGALWVKIFGGSPASLRAFSAFITVITIIGVYLLGQLLGGQYVALYAVLSASIMPWAFHFSRIAWDPPLAPLFVVWGLYFVLRSNYKPDLLGSAILLTLSLYTYPPVRASIPFILIVVWWFKKHQGLANIKDSLWFLVPLILLSVPLVWNILTNPEFLARFHAGNITSERYLRQYGEPSWSLIFFRLLVDYFSHFNFSYLFVRGDEILRHSVLQFGELSWLDGLGITVLLGLLGYQIMRRRAQIFRDVNPLVMVSLVVILASIFPSAITTPSPHALHSITAWPFVSLLVGYGLAWLHLRLGVLRIGISGLALIFSILYLQSVFLQYPIVTAAFFDAQHKTAALKAVITNDWEEFAHEAKDMNPHTKEYFLMHYARKPCTAQQ